jgi:hypothetical protein
MSQGLEKYFSNSRKMSKYENVTKKLINFGKGYDIVT